MRESLTAIGLFVGAVLLGAASFLYPSDLLFQLFLGAVNASTGK